MVMVPSAMNRALSKSWDYKVMLASPADLTASLWTQPYQLDAVMISKEKLGVGKTLLKVRCDFVE